MYCLYKRSNQHVLKGRDIVEAAEILIQTQTSNEAPHGWIVLPLLRSKVRLGIVGWAFGMLLGLGLFSGMASTVIPYNYQLGPVAAIFTTLLLGMLLFIGVGSLWALIADVRRLREADKHVIIITPEDFVKQEGNKIIHVPLVNIRHVTARGTPPPDRTPSRESQIRQVPGAGENSIGFFLGRGLMPSGTRWRRGRMRTPTSLAFIDTRTDSEVIVVTDGAHGDPFMIAALLKQYAAAVQQIAR